MQGFWLIWWKWRRKSVPFWLFSFWVYWVLLLWKQRTLISSIPGLFLMELLLLLVSLNRFLVFLYFRFSSLVYRNLLLSSSWLLLVQIILINGQFPGPRLDVVTNDNIILNLINKLDQPFLLTWWVFLSFQLCLLRSNYYINQLDLVYYLFKVNSPH